MTVLVATPMRANTQQKFIDRAGELYDRLTFGDKDRAVDVNDFPVALGGGRHSKNAMARNQLLSRVDLSQYTHLMWMDVDVIDYPPDLIERLLAVSEMDVVAPFVLVEDTEWFYDTNGFMELDGQMFQQSPPYCKGEGAIHVASVGTCYIAPASVYCLLYDPMCHSVEHLPWMKSVRSVYGDCVIACRDIVITHANLPKWGESWR